MNLLKLLGKLNQLAAIYFALEQAEIEIRAAVPGEVVSCGEIRGLKLFGRKLNIPLNPQVVD